MSAKSKIPWTTATCNPFIGCTKVSEGCQNCYAEKWAIRLNAIAAARGHKEMWADFSSVLKFDYSQSETGKAVGWNGNVCFRPSELEKMLSWREPRMIFLESMGDLFHSEVKMGWLTHVFDGIDQCPQHIFQILTKRPQNISRLWTNQSKSAHHLWQYMEKGTVLPNVWFGASVELPKYTWRFEELRKIDAAVIFGSLEPLLARIDMSPYLHEGMAHNGARLPALDWVIIGCERLAFGRAGRGCENEKQWWGWCIDIVRQCKAADPPVPAFVKQGPLNGKVTEDPEDFPPEARVRDYPERKV